MFDIVQKEYEFIGLSEKAAEKITNTLKRILPIPGNNINTGFEVTEGVYDLVKDTPAFKSIEETSQKLYAKSDRYKGKGIVDLAKDGDWTAAATGDWLQIIRFNVNATTNDTEYVKIIGKSYASGALANKIILELSPDISQLSIDYY